MVKKPTTLEHTIQRDLHATVTALHGRQGVVTSFAVDKGIKYGGNAFAYARSLKLRGVVNGIPDYFIVLEKKLLLVELKKDDKCKLSTYQQQFKDSVDGVDYVVYLKTHDVGKVIELISLINIGGKL